VTAGAAEPGFGFTGQTAIVTGAGSGLGRNYALELARRGARVVVNDIVAGPASAVVEEIRAAGGEAVVDGHSVADPAGGPAIAEAALEAFGRVDVVITNAGSTHFTSVEETDFRLFDEMLALHVRGSFLVAQRAYREMIKQQYGRIVFVSSATGLYGRQGAVGYAAGKGGVIGLMNIFAIEGREHGVLANAVTPIALTSIIGRAPGTPATAPAYLDNPRLQPSFVAPLVVYLASSACRTTHGIFSAVAGRYTRVGIGVGHGWRAPDDQVPPEAEDLARHWGEIEEIVAPVFPASVSDETQLALGNPDPDVTGASLLALAPPDTRSIDGLSVAQRIALRYVACANSSDADGAAALFAENAVWRGQAAEPHAGRSAIRELYRRLYANTPRIRIARWVARGHSCTFQVESIDPHTGTPRGGPLDYLTVDDHGLISQLDVYGPPRS
jgi:NAD(P)-dependent dehydrogenase (short-subunit alcohol dehydrogenase family)